MEDSREREPFSQIPSTINHIPTRVLERTVELLEGSESEEKIKRLAEVQEMLAARRPTQTDS